MIAIGEVSIAQRAIVDSSKRITITNSLPLELNSTIAHSSAHSYVSIANAKLNALQATSRTINTASNTSLNLNGTTFAKEYTHATQYNSIDTVSMKLNVESDEMKIVDCGKVNTSRQIWIG